MILELQASNDTETIGSSEDSGFISSTYTLSRTVKSVSNSKTLSFQIGTPEKFKTLTIPDTNVIDIISCVDSNGNNWYEVDYVHKIKFQFKHIILMI